MKLRGGHSLPIKIAVAERGVDEDRAESVELDAMVSGQMCCFPAG